MLCYMTVTLDSCTWAPAGRGKGGHLPLPGISKLSLLFFISVICITYEGLKSPSQNKPKNIYIFLLFEIFQNVQFFFNFSNLHERSGIG